MNNSWLEETLEIIRDWEKEHDNLNMKIDELTEKIEELEYEQNEIEEKIMTAQALIQAYKEKYNISFIQNLANVPVNSWANKSYPEILIEIAQRSGGYLKVNNAVEFILQSGFSNDKRAIQANVYSTLGRMVQSNRFKKMRPGEYRFLNGTKKSDGKPSGIRQAVKELKDKNPQMTKNEVLNHLIKSGFDFKGKRPANAVNITWAYLGYSQEGKQQSLPGVT